MRAGQKRWRRNQASQLSFRTPTCANATWRYWRSTATPSWHSTTLSVSAGPGPTWTLRSESGWRRVQPPAIRAVRAVRAVRAAAGAAAAAAAADRAARTALAALRVAVVAAAAADRGWGRAARTALAALRVAAAVVVAAAALRAAAGAVAARLSCERRRPFPRRAGARVGRRWLELWTLHRLLWR